MPDSRKYFAIGVLLVLVTLAGCTSTPKRGITASEYIDHVKFLASDELKGRGNGTPELEQAARYIRTEFQRARLQPGGQANYYGYLTITVGSRFGEENLLLIKSKSRESKLELGGQFVPVSFGENNAAELPLVFAGYGISASEAHYDDYEGVDVRGKAVLIFALEPQRDRADSPFDGTADTRHAQMQTKVLNARSHGAVAALIVRGPLHRAEIEASHSDELPTITEAYSVAGMGIPAAQVAYEPVRQVLADAGIDLGELQEEIEMDLKPRSAPVEGVSVRMNVDVKPIKKRVSNVIGIVKGSDPEVGDEVIVVGAHYDHLGLGYSGSMAPDLAGQIHNGADDNASGVSALIEIAEDISLELREPRRTICFVAFASEEMGLLGSHQFVSAPPFPLEKIVAMINMDMIGRLRDKRLLVGGVGTANEFQKLVEGVNKQYGFNLIFDKSGLGAGDHTSFSLKRIPVLFFFTGVHADYHRPSDDWDKINAEGGAMVARFVTDVVRAIDALKKRPAFVEVQEPRMPPGERSGAPRPWFGSVPDFSFQGEGYKFQSVLPGSPAAEAGLQAGDIMVEFSGKPVKNIYDYTAALSAFQPGDKVLVVVLRASERLEVEVTLARRR
jgi:aminopeptidase YwaD